MMKPVLTLLLASAATAFAEQQIVSVYDKEVSVIA
jgi:hypothetical protein